MNKYGREITIEILVGLFMFTVLLALGIFTIVLSRENFFKASYQYEFVFSEVNGLREGDNVYLRGMNIGRVNQTMIEDRQVHVYTTVDIPITLRHGYKIEVVSASMLGGKYLKIYEGPENAPVLGDNVTILGEAPVDVIEELGAAVEGLQAMIDAVNEGQGTMGKLLNDDTIYNNIVVVSENLKEMGESIEKGEGTLARLLQDDTVYENVEVLTANFRDISDHLISGKGTLGSLIYSDSGFYDDFAATMSAWRSISESISEGEGTMGRLVRDARLYDEATLLVEDARAAVDDLREASPITSFGSVLFGAF
jgi:phospholipid/cholesterol/gamma-HCH transport system substrate-binding protein